MPVYDYLGEAPILPADGRWWLAPSATLIGRVTVGEDVGIWFGAVIRGDIERIIIGARTNVQEHSVLHTDAGFPLTIGEGCTVGHRAILHGCTIGANSLIGMGAVVLNGAKVGANCLIGAHALVPEGKEIPENSLVVGVPGKVARVLTPEQIEGLTASADRYVANWKRYAAGGFHAIG